MSNAHVWRAALERLRPQMTRAQFDTWLRGTSLAAAPDGAIVLRVRTTFAKELLETRFRERIESAIAEVSGRPCRLTVAVAPDAASADEPRPDVQVPARTITAHAQAARTLPARRPSRSLRDATAAPTLFDVPPTQPRVSPSSKPLTTTSVGATHASPGLPPVSPAHADVTITTVGPTQMPAGHRGAVPPGRSEEGRPPGAPASRPRPTGNTPTNRTSAPRAAALPRKRPTLAAKSDARSSRVRAALDRSRSGAHELRAPAEYTPDASSTDEPRPSAHPSTSVPSAAESTPLPTLRAGTSGALRLDGQVRSGADFADERGDQLYAGSQLVRPRLNPRYTFASFIVGSGNQLAHAASQAVAEAPGQAYNPLFLYGGVGLGKTHLLHAIGHATMARDLIVLYVSSETFTNEIINAIRYRTTEEFRAKYRSVDVLLVDDIQFIAGKESTEEEFFHTFNSLYETSKQIVICSDRPPKAIVSLEERLRSRFEWGLIADIQPPDLETRVAILRAKADMMGRRVPDDVVTFLAGRVQSNIRELEGSLNRLLAFTQLQGQPLTIETAKAALASLATDGRQRRVTIAEILAAVADFYRISADDLKGKQRDKHIVVPRQVAMYLMRQETEASLLEVGQALGGRDHSTVLHGCEKIAREVNDNTALRKEVLAIRQQLLG